MYQTFVPPAVKLNEKNLILLFRYFDMFTGTQKWLIHRSRWLNEHQHKHTHAQQRRLSTVLLFSVHLSIQKQQSSPSEHTHACVCIHPHFFVYNTTGSLEAVWKHDQMNTEALISQHRENMLPYSPLERRRTYFNPEVFPPLLNDDRPQEVSRTLTMFCVQHLHNNSWPFADI